MFRRMFVMDCRRCFAPGKLLLSIGLIVFLLLFSEWDLKDFVEVGYGSIRLLSHRLVYDRFKILMVIVLMLLYTGSFCEDDNSGYLGAILSRGDVTTYARSRILSNTLVILAASIGAFLLTALVLLPFMTMTGGITKEGLYYYELAREFPVFYLIMMGLQFGIVAAACSSFGLLFSVYQPNRFVSSGIPVLIFFIMVSYIPEESVFDALNLIMMGPCFSKSFDSPIWINYIWGMLYPAVVIVICGYFFYRRLEWRMEHGMV